MILTYLTRIVDAAATWDQYNLFDAMATRRFNVHRELLGLLEGEEVLSAWTVPPRLTRNQLIIIALGVCFFILGPLCMAAYRVKPTCAAEALLGTVRLDAHDVCGLLRSFVHRCTHINVLDSF